MHSKLINAGEIDSVKPGSVVWIDGTKYIKMVDSDANHVHGCLFDVKTGD